MNQNSAKEICSDIFLLSQPYTSLFSVNIFFTILVKKNSVGSELMVVLGSSEMQVWSCPDSVGLETKMLLSGLCSDAREEHLSSGPTVRFLQQLKK